MKTKMRIEHSQTTQQVREAPSQESASLLTLTVVKKLTTPLRFGNGTQTIGQRIDMMLEECAHCGEQVQSLALEVTDDDWARIRQAASNPHQTEPATMMETPTDFPLTI